MFSWTPMRAAPKCLIHKESLSRHRFSTRFPRAEIGSPAHRSWTKSGGPRACQTDPGFRAGPGLEGLSTVREPVWTGIWMRPSSIPITPRPAGVSGWVNHRYSTKPEGPSLAQGSWRGSNETHGRRGFHRSSTKGCPAIWRIWDVRVTEKPGVARISTNSLDGVWPEPAGLFRLGNIDFPLCPQLPVRSYAKSASRQGVSGKPWRTTSKPQADPTQEWGWLGFPLGEQGGARRKTPRLKK